MPHDWEYAASSFLHFRAGDVVTIEFSNGEWMYGSCADRNGWFLPSAVLQPPAVAPPAEAPPEAPPPDEEASPAKAPPADHQPSDARRDAEERIREDLRSALSSKEYEAIQLLRRHQHLAQPKLYDLCVQKVSMYVKQHESMLQAEYDMLDRVERVRPSLKGFNQVRQVQRRACRSITSANPELSVFRQ